ncbi:MAG: peptidylprolyl isomerase [Dehalococcoidia bacterium]|nr:peptidylprolyl isomerase [Dehalococcoidia bacterium]
METVRPRVIVVQSEDDAQSIMEQLDEGENFGTLAQTESLDPTSRQEDGYLEAQPRELLPEELQTALADLDEGETLDEPVEINGNWWIVQLGEVNPEGSLTDAQREQLADQQLTALLEERRQDAQDAGEIERSLSDDDIQWAYDNLEVPAGLTSGQN